MKSWGKQCRNSFAVYVDIDKNEIIDKEFKEHIKYLRTIKDRLDKSDYPQNMYPSPLHKFMQTFHFPYGMKNFIRVYILEDRIDFSLARSSISILSGRDDSYVIDVDEEDKDYYWEFYNDKEELRILIPSGSNVTELREFIAENKDYIDKQLDIMSPNRVKRKSPKYNTQRDARLKDLWNQGLKYSSIAKTLSEEFDGVFDDSDVATMASRLGLKRKI